MHVLRLNHPILSLPRLTKDTGSMADMPKDLRDQIIRLEDLFTVPAQKLKEITDHFVSELERGLREENSTIVRSNFNCSSPYPH